MDMVKIDTGYVSGTTLGEPGKEVYIYRGVPYAAPPVGDLRWKPPQPPAPWVGIRECTAFSKVAPQSFSPIPGTPLVSAPRPQPRFTIPQSEDCLYLNVLTPAKKGTERLPVMVWMHYGGFIFGSANDKLCNTPRLPQYGVVLVNINTRLGPIGLFAHRLLSQESPEGVSGNYMFLDMIAALKWVKRNIAAFGGDPDNVTIFGESGGSAKVITLMASPLARGLFHRIIAESGSPDGKPLKELEERGDRFFAKLGVDKEKDPLKAVRSVPWEKIVEVEHDLIQELHVTGRGGLWDIAVDGWFMPDMPLDVFKSGRQHKIDYILGANAGELAAGPGLYLIPAYVGFLSEARRAGVNAYAYIFNRVPDGWRQAGVPATHAMEVPYVFGDWDNSASGWRMVFGVAGRAGAKSAEPGLTDVDRKVSEVMMTIWTQFAKTGTPNVEGLVTWPTYEEATDQYLYITETLQVKSGFSQVDQGKQ
jgi:para-nitrobenzyl esterase